jgi:hypothetical protein
MLADFLSQNVCEAIDVFDAHLRNQQKEDPESSTIVNSNWEKYKKWSFKLDQHNGLVSAPEKIASILQCEKSSSTQSPPSQSNLDANFSPNCTSFNLTPINDHNSKLDIMHGTGTSNYSSLQQTSP